MTPRAKTTSPHMSQIPENFVVDCCGTLQVEWKKDPSFFHVLHFFPTKKRERSGQDKSEQLSPMRCGTLLAAPTSLQRSTPPFVLQKETLQIHRSILISIRVLCSKNPRELLRSTLFRNSKGVPSLRTSYLRPY